MKKIVVVNGTGSGHTELSAFDRALWNAGIANHNLIPLSSVIPKDFLLVDEEYVMYPDDIGNRLYVVISSARESEVGKEAWAGIGWVLFEGEGKGGLFVEHHGHSQEEVESLIRASLTDMQVYRMQKTGSIYMRVIGVPCINIPVCALVAAIYESQSWK